MKEIIYYGSYIVFPFIGLVLYNWRKNPKILSVFLLLCSVIFIHMRFIEPQMIVVKKHSIETGFSQKIALIADTHLGVYKGERYAQRLVQKLNTLDVDMVLLAGDLTYDPDIEKLDELFGAFGNIQHKVFWVLGNHDIEKLGGPPRDDLKDALSHPNTVFLNNDIVRYNGVYIVGLGSHWNEEDETSLLRDLKEENNVITLIHNPDSTETFPEGISDITFAGHTHGGQIRIPYLYKKVIPTRGDFDVGFSQEQTTPLFITSGLGEVGPPMRLFNPPRIDVIELY